MPIPRTMLKKERNGKAPILDVVIKCYMKNYSQYFTLTLYKVSKVNRKKKRLCMMKLCHSNDNVWETHFPGALPMSERGKGYGIYLYSYAADLASINQFKLRSSYGPSTSAERCWKSSRLKKHYIITKRSDTYWIKPRKVKTIT
jgi:adenosine deaminase